MTALEVIAVVALIGVPWIVGIYFLLIDPIRWWRHNRRRAKGIEIPLGGRRL